MKCNRPCKITRDEMCRWQQLHNWNESSKIQYFKIKALQKIKNNKSANQLQENIVKYKKKFTFLKTF